MKKPQALIGLLAALGTAIGVMVAVIGLPYGRADYSAFAEVYHGTAFAGGTIHLAVDTDPSSPGTTEANTNVSVPGPATVVANVSVHNESGSALTVAGINFNLLADPGGTHIDATAPLCLPPGTSCNPDFLLSGVNWGCSSPLPDEDLDNNQATGDESFISCANAVDPPVAANGAVLPAANITYNVLGALGVAPLTLNTVNVFDENGTEVLSCSPGPGPCFDGSFTFIPPPPATLTPTATNTVPAATATSTNTVGPTNTPTNTATPAACILCPTATPTNDPGINKVPEWCFDADPVNNENATCNPGDAQNLANLFICETGACDGPGEGSLIVHEYAYDVAATDGGLGAYEFSVEYDNFVIASLNPCDIVFSQPQVEWPNGADNVQDGEGFIANGSLADRAEVVQVSTLNCANAADPEPLVPNGTCEMSVILENIIHFGCATGGQNAGPNGNFDLARLTLVPHEDLTNDLFPGNDNGVVTILKDNGCELVNTLGHPVDGSINGGLTQFCEDLAVTVRILEGDLNLDCEVTVDDAQAIAGHYGAFFGSLLYSKWLDLEPNLHDLDIDIKDIQKVFGRIGSTCQNPTPDQTPVPFS